MNNDGRNWSDWWWIFYFHSSNTLPLKTGPEWYEWRFLDLKLSDVGAFSSLFVRWPDKFSLVCRRMTLKTPTANNQQWQTFRNSVSCRHLWLSIYYEIFSFNSLIIFQPIGFFFPFCWYILCLNWTVEWSCFTLLSFIGQMFCFIHRIQTFST